MTGQPHPKNYLGIILVWYVENKIVLIDRAPKPVFFASNGDDDVALWLARIAMCAGLFFGVGGLFAARWLIPGGADGLPVTKAALLIGFSATVVSLGLQGLDALGAPLSSLTDRAVWSAGLATSFGLTVIVLFFAFLLALMTSLQTMVAGRAASLVAAIAGSAALALSGHASSATPQWLVFVHVITIVVWIGSIPPLGSGPIDLN